MHPRSLASISALALSVALAAPAAAQGPMRLSLVGGSYPGSLSVALEQGPIFQFGILAMGIDPGPIPIAVVDPADFRMLDVGVQQLDLFFGMFDIQGTFALAGWTVPNVPAFLDVPLYFQGLSFGGLTTVFDEVSPPEVVRFAPSGTFRDRQVYMTDDRAFGSILPRRDGRWMAVGGGRGALLAQVAVRTTEIHDDVTDSFVFGPQMNQYRSIHTATQLQDGRWLLAGGVDLLNNPQVACEVYDPALDAFVQVAPMGTPRVGHSATLLADGRVLVAGGFDVVTSGIDTIEHAVNSTEIYNPATNTWSPGPNLRTPRVGQFVIPRPNGTFVLCGGVSYDNLILLKVPAVRSTTDIYNPATNTITAGPSMSTGRALIDAVPIGNDRWLVAGGINQMTLVNQGTPTNSVEIYNAVTNTWSSAGSMATARANQRNITLDGNRILVVGGGNGQILTPTPLASGEIYNVATNTWSSGPSLSLARAGAASYVTPRGQVHVIGGGTTSGAIARVCEWWYF